MLKKKRPVVDIDEMKVNGEWTKLQFWLQVHEFILFEKNLMALNTLAADFPQDACKEEVETTTMFPMTTATMATTENTTERANWTEWEGREGFASEVGNLQNFFLPLLQPN